MIVSINFLFTNDKISYLWSRVIRRVTVAATGVEPLQVVQDANDSLLDAEDERLQGLLVQVVFHLQ